MGIIHFIRKMHNFISVALLAFATSTQASFLTDGYATEEGRNLSGAPDRDNLRCLKISETKCRGQLVTKDLFCNAAVAVPGASVKDACLFIEDRITWQTDPIVFRNICCQ